jgi:hypothetical protein
MQTHASQPERVAWYRVPVAWLGLLIFVASLAGCVWIIATSVQYRDEAVRAPGHSVLGVPAHPQPPPASSR